MNSRDTIRTGTSTVPELLLLLEKQLRNFSENKILYPIICEVSATFVSSLLSSCLFSSTRLVRSASSTSTRDTFSARGDRRDLVLNKDCIF